jgi:hypothetical protein
MPEVNCPELPGWEWTKISQKGDITQVILQTARGMEADLIVMSTEGRNGFLDALRGSHTEQVLRHCACPLLAIPAGGWVSSVLGGIWTEQPPLVRHTDEGLMLPAQCITGFDFSGLQGGRL